MNSKEVEKLGDFEQAYFIQTRKEIDTEKRERDHILNVAVVAIGALAFGIFRSENISEILVNPVSLGLQVSALAILTSLFFVRWMKLRQIADRWYVLNHMIQKPYNESHASKTLEAVVLRGFDRERYIKKDIILCLALSLPIYCLIIYSTQNITHEFGCRILTPVIVIGAHIIASLFTLKRKLVSPLDGA